VSEIPNGEAVVTAYLKEKTGERIVGKAPSDRSTPWVRVTLINAPSDAKSPVDHLIAFLIQFDCYAGKEEEGAQAEASALVRSVRAALDEMAGVRSGVTVTGVRFVSMPRVPDTLIEPARERYILTANIFMHP
jgi:hypothetical protein